MKGDCLPRLHGALSRLCILDLLLFFVGLGLVHALGTEFGKESANALLVNLVLGVLARTQQLSQPRTGLEQDQVSKGTSTCPSSICFRLQTAPLVQTDPKGLLSREVWVPRPSKKACRIEAAVQLLTSVPLPGWHLGCLVVFVPCMVKVPLSLVSEELKHDYGDHGPAEQGVVGSDVVAADTVGEKKDVGRSSNQP